MPVILLARAWWCYRQEAIRLADLRVWFAAWEMWARRCRLPSPLPRRFGLEELGRLTGQSTRRLKEALRRLEGAELLRWSESAVEFPAYGPDGRAGHASFMAWLEAMPNHRRRVPVPRRILRLLAGGARPALMAAVLGHLLRCLYLRRRECVARGRVKASWIAETFCVALRRVKEARRELMAMGWLIPLEAEQWALNRWGAHLRINLHWSRTNGVGGCAGLAPPAPDSGAESAPPESDGDPLREDEHQEPAGRGPAGICKPDSGEKTAQAVQSSVPGISASPTASGRPDLRHVVPEDLRETGRLLVLYEQAVSRGLAMASEWDRLRFVAAAEHALAIGTKNPCGLFARLVRGGLWHFATQDDEEAASLRLRRHLHGTVPRRRVEAEPELQLSEDARLVRAVREVAVRVRWRGDPFPLLKREKPEWTRERWDRAVAELGR